MRPCPGGPHAHAVACCDRHIWELNTDTVDIVKENWVVVNTSKAPPTVQVHSRWWHSPCLCHVESCGCGPFSSNCNRAPWPLWHSVQSGAPPRSYSVS